MSIAKITKWIAADPSKSWLTLEEFMNDPNFGANQTVVDYVNATLAIHTLYVSALGFQEYFVSTSEDGVKYSAVIFDSEENLDSAVQSISLTPQFEEYTSARNSVMALLDVTLIDEGYHELGEMGISELIEQLKS